MNDPARASPDGGDDAATHVTYKDLGGQGPRALLIHGFGSDRLSWGANEPALSAAANLSSLDLPGHGDSGMDVGDGLVMTLADRVARVLDQHELRHIHLIGHSLGGAIALTLAGKRPDLVASLVLIAPAGLGHGIDSAFLAEFPDLLRPADAEALLRRLVARPRLISKPLVAHVLAQLQKPGSRNALRTVAKGIAASAREIEVAAAAVVASGMPRMVIWGEQDTINPPADAKLRAFGGDIVLVADAGHLPQVENPRVVNASIANFLGRPRAPDR